MTTICVQIGNTDNKLTQQEWSSFCTKLMQLAGIHGEVHFSGGSPTHEKWQNFAVVVVISTTEQFYAFKEAVTELRKEHKQDSVAWLEGETQFI